jgi:biopolymer transport protein ExbB
MRPRRLRPPPPPHRKRPARPQTKRYRRRQPATSETVNNPYGLGALWKNGDFVARFVLILLVLMSMGSWYIMITKFFEQFRANRRAKSADEQLWRLQDGLAFLATVGSTSPFVGLFGTVWGIYHALTAIGIAGQASIDKVAGPVGEALIMTAIGLPSRCRRCWATTSWCAATSR